MRCGSYDFENDLNRANSASRANAQIQTENINIRESEIITELKYEIEELKNEFEMKESHLKLEISRMKAKLDEQAQIQLGNLTINSFEAKTIDLLVK